MPQPPNMNKMLKQVQEMQAEMVKAQEEAQKQEVEASAGGGMVTVKVNGALEVLEIKIDPDAVDPDDVEMLEDLVLAALRDVVTQANNVQADALGDLGGLGGMLPGS